MLLIDKNSIPIYVHHVHWVCLHVYVCVCATFSEIILFRTQLSQRSWVIFSFFFAKVAELAENSFIIIVVVDLSPVLGDELSAFNGVSEVLIDRGKLLYCFLSLLMMAGVKPSES